MSNYLLLEYPIVTNINEANFNNHDIIKLLHQLLEHMISLGNVAQKISRALGDNGHQSEMAADSVKELIADRQNQKANMAFEKRED